MSLRSQAEWACGPDQQCLRPIQKVSEVCLGGLPAVSESLTGGSKGGRTTTNGWEISS